MSVVKTYRTVGATNNALAYKEIDRQDQVKKKDSANEAIMNFAVAVLAEIGECAKPIYEGDKKVDQWVRFSDVNDAVNKYLNENLGRQQDESRRKDSGRNRRRNSNEKGCVGIA